MSKVFAAVPPYYSRSRQAGRAQVLYGSIAGNVTDPSGRTG